MLAIGLMSGTSLDGVDGVLAEFDGDRCQVVAHSSLPFPEDLKAELLALNSPDGRSELHRAALAANALSHLYAAIVERLPKGAGVIGAHGQTVRHRPDLGYTLQLLNPSLLAELTGIDVVADLRSRDVAAGGQGAPLVPAFHRAVFARENLDVAVLNLGGIGNLSLLHADGRTLGFDTGPGNALLDYWCNQQLGRPYDAGGCWAAEGQVIPELLAGLLAEPFLALPPPRSTGRDLFNSRWLQPHLQSTWNAVDVQATLSEFTAATVADALAAHMPQARQLIVCGGGAFNLDLLDRLQVRAPSVELETSDQCGLPPFEVEAAAFAWLAARFVTRKPGNLPAVTGARGSRILGALYPA
jgi:anhydro-N-acetylmuramic acid kinase